jgi:transporter family-2 protein
MALFFILLIGLVAGMAIGLQGPMASLISQKMGMLESVLIIHLGGAIVALIPLAFLKGGQLHNWRSLPWYTLAAGAFGLIVIMALSYMIPRIGVASALIILVLGQVLVGSVLDHFGLLGAMVRPFDWIKLAGFAVAFFGIWLVIR